MMRTPIAPIRDSSPATRRSSQCPGFWTSHPIACGPAGRGQEGVASPGALYRYWRQGQRAGRLTAVLVAGTLPGVVAGSVIRAELLPGTGVFEFVVAAVLLLLGTWLVLDRGRHATGEAGPPRLPPPVVAAIAAAVGCVGGVYGIGGGAVPAPGLVGGRRPPSRVA